MNHREFMRYTERLKRDMEVLKATHEVVDLSYKIERLKAESEEQTELYSNILKTRRTIGGWIDECDKIPLVPRHDLYAKLFNFEFDPSEKDPHMLAMELQDFALEVTQHAEDRRAAEVQLIFKSLMELADTVIHLKE